MRVEMVSGGVYDIPSTEEMRHEIHAMSRDMQALLREEFRGVKPITLRRTIDRTTFLGSPKAGYIWSLLSFSVTPVPIGGSNTVSLYITVDDYNDGAYVPVLSTVLYIIGYAWASNINTYSKGSMLVRPGDGLVVNPNEAGSYSIQLQLVEVPAEQVGKLYL